MRKDIFVIIILFVCCFLNNLWAFDNEVAKILVKDFYNKLILNEKVSYEEGMELFGNSLHEIILERKFGYRNTEGKLIKKPDSYLLWDCFLKKRDLFLPNELQFKESRVEVAVGQASGLFEQENMQGKIIVTVIITQKDNSYEKFHYDTLVLYVGRQPCKKLAIHVGFSTLNGKRLSHLLGFEYDKTKNEYIASEY